MAFIPAPSVSADRPSAVPVIRNACLSDVSIADANCTGMRIDGILVSELLRVYREHHVAID